MNKTDHELMQLIRNRVEQGIPMSQIASEIGVETDDLCDWIMQYKEPRRRRSVRKDDPPIKVNDKPIVNHWSLSQAAQRFANWQKSRDGARQARGDMH